jgi:hypothetical protein
VLTVALAGAHFPNPEIHDKLGYHGQRAIPIERRHQVTSVDEELLAPVIRRGPGHRDPSLVAATSEEGAKRH